MKVFRFPVVFFFLLINLNAQTIKVATINVWSGLDYHGKIRMGYYEPDSIRKMRLELLIQDLRTLIPDIISIQEANPITRVVSQIARELGYDEIHQVCNAGLKFGSLGYPTNLREGNAILAHPRLHLKLMDVSKLYGSFGFLGDIFSFHTSEVNFAIVGKVVVDSIPVIVVNVHLKSCLPLWMKDTLEHWRSRGKITNEEFENNVQQLMDEESERKEGFTTFINELTEEYKGIPILVMGDFNTEPESEEIQFLMTEMKFINSQIVERGQNNTWDTANINVACSLKDTFECGDRKSVHDLLTIAYDYRSRRIDYIFAGGGFDTNTFISSKRILDVPHNGLFISDHYGIQAEVLIAGIKNNIKPEHIHFTSTTKSEIEGFPILTYDTDVGFGYGAKGFFLNNLGFNESVDITLFNSVNIERWYRLVISMPDFELRQGKIYPLAFDLIIDYDKYLEANLFDVGNDSKANSKTLYTREPLEISLIASRGFRQTLAAQFGLKFKTVSISKFPVTYSLKTLTAGDVEGRKKELSLIANMRYDSRDSYINPRYGTVLQCEIEGGSKKFGGDFGFLRTTLNAQYFTVLFHPTTVFAVRAIAQHIEGKNLPIWARSVLGGNNTLRGYPMDRFLDNGMILVNAELRLPIYRRLRGVAFYDVGRVWRELQEFRINDWHSNTGIGLRFVMDTFIVRLDIGFSNEAMGLYFNFGHAF